MADLDTQSLRRAMGATPRDHFGLVGQVVDEQFRVDAVIGEGGFSVVYRGYHLGLSEPLAIKCLKLPGALGSAAVESFVQRFRDEGRILYKLSQGNLHIVRSIASGMTMAPSTGALVPYTVLEWLEGFSLAEELEARRRAGLRGRTLAELVPLLDSALQGVAYAHIQGVVHRDLNPGNIFFAKTREGMRAKVLDFGLAKVVSDHALALGPRAETLSHLQIFAPAYAAPEQMDKRLGAIGPQTDVYTIALVLLECMTDRAVISGDHLGEIMAKTLGLHRPTPSALGLTVSEELEALFASAMDLDPTKRPADAGVFWGTLKHALAKEGTRPRSIAPAPPPPSIAMSPLEAFKNLPSPASVETFTAPTSRAGASAQGPGSTFLMSPEERASGEVAALGRSASFPRLASTMPLGDAAAEARRRASAPPADTSAGGQASPAVAAAYVPPPPSTERKKRIAVVLLALIVAGMGLFFLVRGFLDP